MRVSKIQPQYLKTYKTNFNTKPTNYLLQKNEPPKPEPQFKGTSKGILTGLGTGVATTLLIVGGLAISGTLVLPAIIGGTLIAGGGVGGAVLGNKIEDKINEHLNKKK